MLHTLLGFAYNKHQKVNKNSLAVKCEEKQPKVLITSKAKNLLKSCTRIQYFTGDFTLQNIYTFLNHYLLNHDQCPVNVNE